MAPSQRVMVERLTVPMDSTYTELLTGAGTPASFRVFTPIPAQWFESIRLRPDLATTEQLSVRIVYNTSAQAYGGSIPILTVSPYLWTFKHTMDKKNYDLINAKNMGKPGGLNLMLTSNYFTEKVSLGSSDTASMAYRFLCNYPVFKTHFGIKLKTTAVTHDTSISFWPINTFDFQVGGQSVFNSAVPSLVCNYDSAVFSGKLAYGANNTLRMENPTGMVTIDWGMLGDDRYMNSGCISFANLNNPTLNLVFGTIVPANYDLWVVHEYWQHLAKDGTGQLEIVLAQ